MNIVYPTLATLNKYGLSLQEWKAILRSQGNVCPICKKFPTSGKFVIDHEHVKRYRYLPRDERRKRVRGITCWMCNRYYLARGVTVEKAQNIITYLQTYQDKTTK